MTHKPAITATPILEAISHRWSGRAFAETPIASEQLLALMEAARWAPSCFGDQPWRFVLWSKAADAASWQAAVDTLAPSNQAWAQRAPVLLLVAHHKVFNHNGQNNRWASYDAGAATENLCIQAAALGLMTHQMGGFDANKAKALANVPEGVELMAMVAIGYPGEADLLADDLKTRELAPRQRKPLGELFFNATWDTPAV